MKIILMLLLTLEAVFLVWAIFLGLEAESVKSILKHVNLGILAAIYTMFIHCLVLFYLIGSHRSIKQVVSYSPELETMYVPFTRRIKKRIFPLATFSIIAILLTAFAGTWVHTEILSHYPRFPVRAVPGWWLHLSLLIPALLLNFWTFWREIQVVGENVDAIHAINRQLAEELPVSR